MNGILTVEVDQGRYDELLHKEALLEAIVNLHGRMSDYVFRDAVGYLLKSDAPPVQNDA
jgi:hypothetical protein